ncbi:hypothetical protein [Gloeobacter kilaueensis]|nr:hypothetical protein [Gloeobacter kilaueensis]
MARRGRAIRSSFPALSSGAASALLSLLSTSPVGASAQQTQNKTAGANTSGFTPVAYPGTAVAMSGANMDRLASASVAGANLIPYSSTAAAALQRLPASAQSGQLVATPQAGSGSPQSPALPEFVITPASIAAAIDYSLNGTTPPAGSGNLKTNKGAAFWIWAKDISGTEYDIAQNYLSSTTSLAAITIASCTKSHFTLAFIKFICKGGFNGGVPPTSSDQIDQILNQKAGQWLARFPGAVNGNRWLTSAGLKDITLGQLTGNDNALETGYTNSSNVSTQLGGGGAQVSMLSMVNIARWDSNYTPGQYTDLTWKYTPVGFQLAAAAMYVALGDLIASDPANWSQYSESVTPNPTGSPVQGYQPGDARDRIGKFSFIEIEQPLGLTYDLWATAFDWTFDTTNGYQQGTASLSLDCAGGLQLVPAKFLEVGKLIARNGQNAAGQQILPIFAIDNLYTGEPYADGSRSDAYSRGGYIGKITSKTSQLQACYNDNRPFEWFQFYGSGGSFGNFWWAVRSAGLVILRTGNQSGTITYDTFIYFLLGLPAITGTSAPNGAPGDTVTIYAYGLWDLPSGQTSIASIKFGGVPVAVVPNADPGGGSVTVVIPAGAASGPIVIALKDGPTGTSPFNFTITGSGGSGGSGITDSSGGNLTDSSGNSITDVPTPPAAQALTDDLGGTLTDDQAQTITE